LWAASFLENENDFFKTKKEGENMAQNSNKTIPNQRANRRLKKGRAALLVAVFLLIVTGITYAIFDGDSSKTVSGLTTPLKGKINILVLGADEREDDVGRSDTTFVATIDTDVKKVTMLSIPRDTRVKIPGHGWDKINHAYAFGGSKLSKTSVENLLGIKMDYTVVVNINDFVRMIDAIGGVTIDVDKRMKYADPYDDNGGLYIDLQPGVQRLKGKTAIEYVRYRDEEGDIGRVARQQKFLKALLQEFTKPQLITKLPEIVKQFSTAVRTDMPKNKMLKLIPIVSDVAKSGLKTEWIDGTPIWIQDVSYWLPDIKELRAKVAQIQGITVNAKYNQATELLSYEYQQSIPKEIKIADVPPVVETNVEKQPVTTTKVSLEPNKSKAETTQVTGKNNSVPKTTSVTTNHNLTVQETRDGMVHKNATPSSTLKQ
jgi:polyisoprenyl-teichoic acid--peptidoglycan teichoic acid transferase